MTTPARPDRARAVQTLAGAAVLITVVTLASRVVGFGRWLAQASYLGTGGVDAPFNSANLLPNVLFEIAAGGALAGAVVPLLSGFLVRGDRERASRTASALLGWTLVVLVPLGALMALLAEPVAGLLRLREPAHVAVAADFLRVFAVQVPLYGVAVVLGGVLQAHRRFFWPAFAPLVSSLVVIAVYAVFGSLADGRQQDVAALSSQALGWLAWGTTAGVAFLALPLLVPTARTGLRLRPTLRFPDGEGRRAARLAFAGVGALVAQQLSLLAIMGASNEAGDAGTFTVYLYAQQVYLLPYAVLAFPIATSAFPRFSEHAAEGRWDALARLVSSTTRTLVVAVTAGVAALLAAAPAVEDVFDLVVAAGDAAGLASALTWMAPGLVGYALVLQLSRALYAVDAGRPAVVATATGWAVVALGAGVTVLAFAGHDTPTAGTRAAVLAWLGGAVTVGMVVAGVGLLLAVRRRLGAAALRGVVRTVAVSAVAAAAGAVLARWAVPAVRPAADAPFDLGVFSATAGLGLLAGLLAAAVVVVAGALADADVRARLATLARRTRGTTPSDTPSSR
ncbi:murein biosynthesis integral membrane protein MurJ [Isoptericola variabilis]|uniref:Virulence factor MVIN family protein n=1 Tax=Isoptericola variabilis (strain 225) TaxID=743718 RepID=F6FT56_ISOV2|nr:lipid II flippase MurJ [Isoptericola variabilis]AEG44127.1 virulence factor MVIN family protein [Isoptericola variabilis 225]TWH28561.1 putative peptidoglycan lipid II flippase [Isoptericola variabilis J7]